MKNLLRKGVLSIILVLALSPAGCAGTHEGGDDAKGTSSGSVSTDPVVVQGIIQDQTLVATVHPIEVLDDYAVLTVDYSVPENTASLTELWVGQLMARRPLDLGGSGVRIIDIKTGRVWLPGYDPENSLGDTATKPNKHFIVKPGQPQTTTTLFPLVDTDTVDVLFPFLGFAYNVPVVDGNAETPTIESLGIKFMDGHDVVFPEPLSLSSFIQSYDNNISATKEGNQQRIILASDVLFASDVYTLSAPAAARVDQVAQEIAQSAPGGEIRVTGHTDDVGTDIYNLDLSNKRAGSVAERLKATLGSSFSVISEGKGESSPKVEGKDEEARAANRRVEIAFTSDHVINISYGDTQPAANIPATNAPVATRHNPVEYEYKPYSNTEDMLTMKASVPSVQRHGSWLVGSVTVTKISGKNSALMDMLGSTPNLTKQEYNTGGYISHNSARTVTLLTPNGRVFPAQYTVRTAKTTPVIDILADRFLFGLNTNLKPGQSVTYTVIWPDTGQDVVTIDVPDRFRITDIPVEEI